MRCLEIGGYPIPLAESLWEGEEIEHLNAWDVAIANSKVDWEVDAFDVGNAPPELIGRFDHIIASHVLEHVFPNGVLPVLKLWASWLKPEGGKLHIIVPSLEWAARQILSETPDPPTWAHLFGGHISEWDVHHTGFTMRLLRKVFEDAGLHVVRATTAPYNIGWMGKEYLADNHYVAGVNLIAGAPAME